MLLDIFCMHGAILVSNHSRINGDYSNYSSRLTNHLNVVIAQVITYHSCDTCIYWDETSSSVHSSKITLAYFGKQLFSY
jgi:hypothetical protein